MWLADAAAFSLALVALMALLYLQNRCLTTNHYPYYIHAIYASNAQHQEPPAANAVERSEPLCTGMTDSRNQTFQSRKSHQSKYRYASKKCAALPSLSSSLGSVLQGCENMWRTGQLTLLSPHGMTASRTAIWCQA